MKVLLIGMILVTLAMIFLQYKRGRDGKKLLLSLGSFAVVITLAVMGNLTRPVIPLFIAHLVLLVLAWGSVLWYILRDRFYWWLILSPIVTIVLFLVMEILMGSGHEYLGEMV